MPLSLCAAALGLTLLVLGSPALAETATKEKVMAAIPELEDLAKQVIAKGQVPGLSVAVVYKDEVVYLGGFGLREIGKPGKVDADTVFHLASLAKPLSATVVAALVSDGIVSWDSRIADLDPAFKLHDAYPTEQVTITDLFNHRSGLSGNAGDDLEALGFDRAAILPRLHYLKPTSSFRAGYAYSNFGLTEGAVAAAKPTGKSWEDVCNEKLFKPLGMRSTSPRHADFLTHENRAEMHVPIDGKWTALIKRNPDPQAPAGGTEFKCARSCTMDAPRARRRQIQRRAAHQARGDGADASAAVRSGHQPGHRRAHLLWAWLEHRFQPPWDSVGPCRRIQPGRAHGG